MRHYLTVKTGEIPNVREVYEAFKAHARSPGAGGVEALIGDVRRFSGYFCKMALGAEDDADLRVAFQDIRELTVEVAFPFLLELYHDYADRHAPQGRAAPGDTIGGKLRVPPRSMQHPDQFSKQNLRHLRPGAEKRSLHREHTGALFNAAILQAFSR